MVTLYNAFSFLAGKICPPFKIDKENNRVENRVPHQMMTYFLITVSIGCLWAVKPAWGPIQGTIFVLIALSIVFWMAAIALFQLIRRKKPNTLSFLIVPSYLFHSLAFLLIISSVNFPSHRKSKISEAKTNLYHLYTLQEAYHQEKSKYLNLSEMGNLGQGKETICDNKNELGFQLLDGCERIRFSYSASTSESGNEFVAKATAYPGPWHPYGPKCNTALILTVNQDKVFTIENLEKVQKTCPAHKGWFVH